MTLNLEHPKITGETTVQNAITEVAAMMGENVRLRRGFVMSSQGVISTYLHTSPQPGKRSWIDLFLFIDALVSMPTFSQHVCKHTYKGTQLKLLPFCVENP